MNIATKKLIGIVQMCSTANKQENLDFIAKALKIAGENGTAMCFLPECFAGIQRSKEDNLNSAEYLDGQTIRYLGELAKKYNLWLSLGGFQQKILGNDEKISNSHIIIDNNGVIQSVYSKLHLFDVQIDEKNTLAESSSYVYGDKIAPVVESPVGRLGVAICYDLRFPELFRILTLQKQAEILLIPSAFLTKTGAAHWHTLLRARAIENQCYVIAAAQAGQHNEKRESYGHSLVIDPWGDVLLDMGPSKTGIDFVELNLEKIQSVRKNMPCQNHIRNDIYSLTSI